ncbi:MAG: class B sortase [Clostridiales bacterium]|nr:class B sortase [Clostridiales bacterium]
MDNNEINENLKNTEDTVNDTEDIKNGQRRPVPVASSGRNTGNSVHVASASKEDGKTAADNRTVGSEELFASAYKEQKQISEAMKNSASTAKSTANTAAVHDKTAESARDNKYKILFVFLSILIVVIFAVSCLSLFIGGRSEEITGSVSVSSLSAEDAVSLTLSSPFSYEQTYNVDFPEGIQEKYKALYAQNTDFVGWLSLPGTSIDTPVYQTTDNSYYLKHDNFDTYTKYGVPFMDYENGVATLSRNTVIYGHNFDNDLIFDEIHNYEDVEYYKQYPVIEFNTIYSDYKWKVIAAFRTNGDSTGDNDYLFYYIATSMGDNSFMDFYDEIMQRSYIDTGVDVQSDDKILTLSTCTYFFDKNGSLENARFVLVARLVREGESEEVDTSNAVQRDEDEIRYPQLYYDVFGGTNPYKNASKWYASSD